MFDILIKAFGKKDISKLTKKRITNKLGHSQTVYVQSNKKTNHGKKEKNGTKFVNHLESWLDEHYSWKKRNILARDAEKWIKMGLVAKEAEKWSSLNYTPEEAAQYIKQGIKSPPHLKEESYSVEAERGKPEQIEQGVNKLRDYLGHFHTKEAINAKELYKKMVKIGIYNPNWFHTWDFMFPRMPFSQILKIAKSYREEDPNIGGRMSAVVHYRIIRNQMRNFIEENKIPDSIDYLNLLTGKMVDSNIYDPNFYKPFIEKYPQASLLKIEKAVYAFRNNNPDMSASEMLSVGSKKKQEWMKWKEKGFTPSNYMGWQERGFTPEEAKKWEGDDFTPHEAANWRKAGYRSYEAAKRVAAGYTNPEDVRPTKNG